MILITRSSVMVSLLRSTCPLESHCHGGPNDTALVIMTFLMALLEYILLARMLLRWPRDINVGLVSFKRVS